MNDLVFMQRAIELARLGRRAALPNPMVGCVVIRDGELLAEGHHARVGAAHAEVDALQKIGFRAEGATLYVNLEPCCHHGRTPPCTDAVLRARVKRVVVAMQDPDARVDGRGLAILRDAGIEVDVGLQREEAEALNEIYLVQNALGRPFVTVKAAATLDGRTASSTGDSAWITADAARADARSERGCAQAVLVGVGTVLRDDPLLTARDGSAEPVRIVLDSHLRTPPTARLFEADSPLVIVAAGEPDRARADALLARGAEVIAIPGGPRVDLAAALALLQRRGVVDVFCEGGATLHGALHRLGAVDRVLLYVAPKWLGDGRGVVEGWGATSLSSALPLLPPRIDRIGPDLRIETRRADIPGAAAWRA